MATANTAELATKAAQAAAFPADTLRQMLKHCTGVEGIVALELIRRAEELRRDIACFASAMDHDHATPA